MTELSIRPVDRQLFRQVVALQVAANQRGFIEPNAQSLAEAWYEPEYAWHPLALMQGEVVVGFAMVGAYHGGEHYLWLDRFMIGEAFQHQGLGRQFLDLLIARIRRRWNNPIIVLSYEEENHFAAEFYARHGFKSEGRIDPSNGEVIATLAPLTE